jgi:hypothetical protein
VRDPVVPGRQHLDRALHAREVLPLAKAHAELGREEAMQRAWGDGRGARARGEIGLGERLEHVRRRTAQRFGSRAGQARRMELAAEVLHLSDDRAQHRAPARALEGIGARIEARAVSRGREHHLLEERAHREHHALFTRAAREARAVIERDEARASLDVHTVRDTGAQPSGAVGWQQPEARFGLEAHQAIAGEEHLVKRVRVERTCVRPELVRDDERIGADAIDVDDLARAGAHRIGSGIGSRMGPAPPPRSMLTPWSSIVGIGKGG